MKFNPGYQPHCKFHPTLATVLLATVALAAHRGTPIHAGGGKGAAVAEPEPQPDEIEDLGGDRGEGDTEAESDETSQPTGEAAATATGTGTANRVTTKSTDEAVANPELVTLIKTYDDVKEQAKSYMCDIAEYINKNKLGRPVVIKTLMEARGLTIESAASNASRLMKLAKDPDLIKALRDGTATIRETVYGKGKTSNSRNADATGTTGAGAAAGGNGGKSDTEKKEDKYNRTLGIWADVAKECGYSLDTIMTGVRAVLKDKGIK